MKKTLLVLAAVGGLVFGTSAKADSIDILLTEMNIGGTGPFANIHVEYVDSTHATITGTAFTSSGYYFVDGGSIGLNVNATTFTNTGFSSTTTLGGFGTPTFSNGGAGNEDGFGKFNDTINQSGSFGNATASITFTLTNTSGTWSSASNVLTPNASGYLAAAHIAVCDASELGYCDQSAGAINTGFAVAPGPIVGAGLPGLVLACGGLLALARRRRRNAA